MTDGQSDRGSNRTPTQCTCTLSLQIEITNAHRILAGNPECKKPLRRVKFRGEDNIKMDIKKIIREGVIWYVLYERSLTGNLRSRKFICFPYKCSVSCYVQLYLLSVFWLQRVNDDVFAKFVVHNRPVATVLKFLNSLTTFRCSVVWLCVYVARDEISDRYWNAGGRGLDYPSPSAGSHPADCGAMHIYCWRRQGCHKCSWQLNKEVTSTIILVLQV